MKNCRALSQKIYKYPKVFPVCKYGFRMIKFIFAPNPSYMLLQSVEKIEDIRPEDFKRNYYDPMKPVILTGLSKQWPAYHKWNWEYFKKIVGDVEVGVYNNIKSDSDMHRLQRSS